ncbi:ECF transporter S component [Mycoplasmopsis phocirhinis]|uniref:ECF transporter S component n=1 Tax=Mycoplasmopsis phocirhinis TaxID=142650 RepID=A0A4P6MRA7_9BACT|nr:ECF transporter S component [Mycoplasmopsis phocirhinis]QBF34579.1 ECF transporter S component [Mycoplasmopsis phocirhinis]
MQNYESDKDFKAFSRWSIRKITFIGILIAISVAFFLIVFQLMPLISLPSYKISIIGLPIKITGFIFGPFVGAFVGAAADLISFMFVPTYFNPLFLLAAVLDGVIPGIIGWLFVRLIRFMFGGPFQHSLIQETIQSIFKKIEKLQLQPNKNDKKIKTLENRIIKLYLQLNQCGVSKKYSSKLLNINMAVCLSILAIVSMIVIYLIGFRVSDQTIRNGIIPNRWALLFLMLSGYFAMILFIFITRFKLKSTLYLIIVPIVVFSALIELFNVPILALAEKQSIGSGTSSSIFVYMFQHIILSPVKIWGNMFIIFFTYKIISPLIYKNHSISY